MRKSPFVLALSLMVALVWLGSQLNQPRAAEEAKPLVQKWEYRTAHKPEQGDEEKFSSDLKKRGLEGWEMCGVEANPGSPTRIYFKRPLQ